MIEKIPDLNKKRSLDKSVSNINNFTDWINKKKIKR